MCCVVRYVRRKEERGKERGWKEECVWLLFVVIYLVVVAAVVIVCNE